MKHLFSLLIVAFFTVVPASAQEGMASRYNMTYLNLASGLSNNFVDDIFQDSNGFVWISTHGGGLVRYDGYSFMNLSLSSEGIQLRSNASRNVYEDGQKRLWAAFEEGYQVLNLHTLQPIAPEGKTEQITARLRELTKESCLRVYCDSKGGVWLILQNQICRLAFDEKGKVSELCTIPHIATFPDIPLRDVYLDGSVVTNFNGHITRLTAKGGRLVATRVPGVPQEVANMFVTDILKYRGALWIATTTGLYNNRKGKHTYSAAVNDGSLQHSYVSSLAIDANGRLLIGTLGGVDILDDKSGTLEHWNCNSRQNPLSSNFVNCLFAQNGLIWVGTETSGVVKLSPRQLSLVNYTHHDDANSLSPNAVNAMYAQADGTIWIGTVEGGLNRLKKGGNTFEHFTAANSGLVHNTVSALEADVHGRLWIGTWGGGISWLSLNGDGKNIAPTHWECDAAHRPLLVFIGALAYDRFNDGLWIGANEGVFFLNFKQNKLEEPFEGCRKIKGSVGSIVTKEGRLLMGSLQGMLEVDLKSRKLDKRAFKYVIYRNKLDQPESQVYDKLVSFCQTHDGTVWTGSANYGLYRLNWDIKGKMQAKAFTTQDGLANNFVKGIVEGKDGMLWITTDYGLSLFNPKTHLFNNFSEADGLVSSQFYYNSAIKDAAGRIYLGSNKGLVALQGVSPSYVQNKTKLHFTRLMVDNSYVYSGGDNLDEDISEAKKIRLHESDRSFSIEFSALNYGSETQGVYRYRMKGFENEWILLQPGQHSVRYSTLPAGSYQFEVSYSPTIGTGGEQVISIDVKVSPYFYKSWWFITALLALAIILARYIYLKRLEEMRNREVELLYKPIEAALKESEEPGKLQFRIQNILKAQERYHESQIKTVEADKEEIIHSVRPFMDKVVEIMETNYQDSEFGVTELAEKLGMNRSALSKKLNAETGVPTSQFIRNYRLDIAKKMIEDNVANRNITEIAYRVGFNDPKYFTRCFTKQFGISPSAYKESAEK